MSGEGKEIHTFEDGSYVISIRGNQPNFTVCHVTVESNKATLLLEPELFTPIVSISCAFYKPNSLPATRALLYSVPMKNENQIQGILDEVKKGNATPFIDWVTRPELVAYLVPPEGGMGERAPYTHDPDPYAWILDALLNAPIPDPVQFHDTKLRF